MRKKFNSILMLCSIVLILGCSQDNLEKNYDLTTATYLGAYELDFSQDSAHRADGTAIPFGFAFSGDGMNLYYVQKQTQ